MWFAAALPFPAQRQWEQGTRPPQSIRSIDPRHYPEALGRLPLPPPAAGLSSSAQHPVSVVIIDEASEVSQHSSK